MLPAKRAKLQGSSSSTSGAQAAQATAGPRLSASNQGYRVSAAPSLLASREWEPT